MDNKERAARIALQIEKRLDVLSRWFKNGVPEGYALPSSLNKVREWNDQELGIEKIGSPSSFTTGHKAYGRLVTKISKVLIKLNAPTKKKKQTNPAKQLQQLKATNENYEEAFVNSANQYASLRIDLDKYQKLYRVARQSQSDVQQELDAVEETIRELKAELVRERARSSHKKITSIEFRGKGHGKQDR